jgi:uncharacterized membrane protein
MSEAPKPPSSTPESTPPPPPATASPTSTTQVGGLDANVAAALSYFLIIAIVWLILEPYNKNRFIRFHAIQAIGLAVVSMGLSIVLGMIPILGWIMLIFLPIVIFVAAILCAVKAFQNQWFKLPVIGDFAEKQAGPA